MQIKLDKYFSKNEIYVKASTSGAMPLYRAIKITPKFSIEMIREFRIGRYGRYVRIPLIFEVSGEWFYLSELLRTDGHISKNLDRIKLTNNSQFLKSKFKNILKKHGVLHFREKEYDRIQVFGKTLAWVFVRVFKIPAGNKTFICRMPGWMRCANVKLLACALRGAFDGDGCVQLSNGKSGGPTRRIRLYGASVGYLKDIQESLSRFHIGSSIFKDPRKNRTYFLQISKREDILRYAKNIGFHHPKRKKALKKVVSSYGDYHFIGDFERIIRDLVKKNGPLSIKELAEEVNRRESTVSEQITKLEKQGKVKTKRVGVRRIVSI
jgi:hypothetical protein